MKENCVNEVVNFFSRGFFAPFTKVSRRVYKIKNKFLIVSDTPFTIIVPKLNFDASTLDEKTLTELVFEHVIPNTQIKSLKNGDSFENLNQNTISIKNTSPEKWTVNELNVLKFNSMSTKLISFIEIDGYLNDRKNNFAKRNIQEHNR